MKKLFLLTVLFFGAAHAGIYPVKSLKQLVSKNGVFKASLDFKADIGLTNRASLDGFVKIYSANASYHGSSLLYQFDLKSAPLDFNDGSATFSTQSNNLSTQEEETAELKITYIYVALNNYVVKVEIKTFCNHEDILYAQTSTQAEKLKSYNYASAYTAGYQQIKPKKLPLSHSDNNLFYMTHNLKVTHDPFNWQLLVNGQVSIYNNSTPLQNGTPQGNPAYRFIIDQSLELQNKKENSLKIFSFSGEAVNNMTLTITYTPDGVGTYSQDITARVYSIEDPESCNSTIDCTTGRPIHDVLRHSSIIRPKTISQYAYDISSANNDSSFNSSQKMLRLRNGTEFTYIH
ncbi:hypothetical protein MRY82_00170 [bacterium]|nr:hypothetical protein [bacterium]